MKSNGVRLTDELRPVKKLICVRLGSIDTPLTVKEETSFAKFFLSFNVQAVSDAESLEGFVDKVKQCKEEWISTTRETTGVSKSDNIESELQDVEQDILQTLKRLKTEEELRHKDNGVCHVRYLEENSYTQQNDVFVLAPINSFNKSHEINYDTIESLNELYKTLKQLHRSPEVFEANSEFIYNKILLTFFKFKAIYGLAQIAAICKQRQILERCFLYLELLLLQKDELKYNNSTLQDMQLKLTKVLKYLRTECPKGGDQFTDSSVKKLSQILVMVDVLKYLNHKRKGSSRSDENFRKKIRSFLLECNKVGESDAHITTALRFLMESPGKLQNAITKQISKKNEKLLAKIWSSKKLSTHFIPSPKQIVCVIGFIKRLFSGTNSMRKELLDCCFKKITTSKVNMNPVVISMLKHGVVMFLTHGIKNISHQHSQEISEKGIMLLKSLSSKEPQDEMCHDLSVLLFSNVPTIRKGVIEIFYEFKIYNTCLKPFLVLEVINKLAPFLEINDEVKPKFIEKEHQEGWITLCAEFSHKPARAIAHCPSASLHHVDNHTEFGQDCAYKNELDLLKSLRHENIIQLLAYHMRSIPQFYIIEDHANFQQMLRLKNWKRDYYSASLLHSFVIQAAVAVEHCHQSDIVVACITAKSFVVTDTGQLKLGDLRCAKRLNGLSEMLIATSSSIPMRWCAPETLKRLKISFQSDYWMYGCLMEEVLTHGAPPNSHTPCDDKTYVNQVYENTNQLYHEKCINDQHFQIIKLCVQHDPNQRLSISQAIYQLKQVDQEKISTEQPNYPNLEKEKRVPESDLKPVSELQTYCNLIPSSPMSVKDLSETLKEYTVDCRVFIRELLKPCSLSVEVLDKIGKGVLDLILPKVDVITTPEGAQCIDVYLPTSCKESVLDLLSTNHLVSIEDIMVQLLTKLINVLQVFHDHDLILGDFNLSTIYVFNYPDISVLPVSLGKVETSSSNSDVNVKYKADGISSKRSTPQNPLANKASSDVYVFGKFLVELLQVIRSGEHIYETVPNNQQAALYEAGSVWLQNLAVLMTECLHEDPVKRPTLAEIKSSLLQLHVRGERSNIQEINEKLLEALANREDNESVYASVDNISAVYCKQSRPLPPVPKVEEVQLQPNSTFSQITDFRVHQTERPELQPNLNFSVHQITDSSAQKTNQTELPHESNVSMKETKVQGAPGDMKQYAFSEIPCYDDTGDLAGLNTQIFKHYLPEYSTCSDISPFSTLRLSPCYGVGAEKELEPNSASNTETMRQFSYSGVKTSEEVTRSSRASNNESLNSTSFSVTDTRKEELTPSKISRAETLRNFEYAIPENYSVPESTERDLECRNLETTEEMASNYVSSTETLGSASHSIQKTVQEFKRSRDLHLDRNICVNSEREKNKKVSKNEFQEIGKSKLKKNYKEKTTMSHFFVMSI